MTATTRRGPGPPRRGRVAEPPTGLLIIGASQSGVQLAVSLRALGFDEHITLLGDEDHRPYQRPALSKEFLQGTVESESLIFRSNDYWDEHNIALVKGERINAHRQGRGRLRRRPRRLRVRSSRSNGWP